MPVGEGCIALPTSEGLFARMHLHVCQHLQLASAGGRALVTVEQLHFGHVAPSVLSQVKGPPEGHAAEITLVREFVVALVLAQFL